ncbi:hypothetical protein [Photorhabdus noenieputensis]|uniref:hypothetical protein n=1 Tax=Photorhabdus noenieputensis TaxID=1208607 RepID=UPI001BD5443D|nr:hypothetical protein [Photorhabdus noenieputensis]MCK3668310.1 hypothetical protein [Photorhabdus noenieputensis]
MTTRFCSGKPPGAARGGDGEHGNEQGACDCEPRAASAAGLGRGEVNNGGRRPTCLQGCWPDVGTAAKEEHGFLPMAGSAADSRRRQPCAPHPSMLTRGGARHNANYTH